MAMSLQEREDELRQQVRELRVEIDRNRQAKQVADIVETEYFQSLRSQARDLRQIVANASARTAN
jgi:predicted component of type VI protein secretion system